jgi:triacylglycerol lipase
VFSGLPPARRRLLLGVVATVAVLAAVLVVTLVVRGGGDDVTPAAQDRPGPVLLVPGYGGSTESLTVLAGRLRAAGRDATVVQLPGGGTGDLAEQAAALGRAVDAALARTGAGSVDLVGYSAGGVVARLWVHDAGRSRTRRVVTLGSPHHGTSLARLAGQIAPSQCPLACQQLEPDSDLLRTLNRGDETPAGPVWISIWTSRDETVTPPDSARLDGATDIVLQDVCASSTTGHGGLPTDPLVTGIVLAELGTGPVTQPAAGDCARLSASDQ